VIAKDLQLIDQLIGSIVGDPVGWVKMSAGPRFSRADAVPDPVRREVRRLSEGAASLGRPVGSRGSDTRRRIITATMQCVAEMGYARATIREIARAADMTSGSLYHYFPNKAEIVRATYIEVSEETMPGLAAAVDEADGVVDKLAALIGHGSEIVRDYPYVVAFDRAVRAPGVGDAGLSQLGNDIFASLRVIVEGVMHEAHRRGELSPEVSLAGATSAVFAVMRGLYDYTAVSSPDEYRATVAAMQLLLRGTLLSPTIGEPGAG
jgi:AcrR family transcriptional regulator